MTTREESLENCQSVLEGHLNSLGELYAPHIGETEDRLKYTQSGFLKLTTLTAEPDIVLWTNRGNDIDWRHTATAIIYSLPGSVDLFLAKKVAGVWHTYLPT